MRTFTAIDQASLTGQTCLTIGNFDGLHRGHQALMRQLIQVAQQKTSGQSLGPLKTGIITFDPHPLAVLRPDHPHKLLTTPAERVALAAKQGIDYGVIQPFTQDVAALDARAFIQLLKAHLGLAALVVGPDFALGRAREGDLSRLEALGQEFDYTLHVMEPIAWQGYSVRSSEIRKALGVGDVTLAQMLLGRPYHVTGLIVYGDQRGRQLGVPTANVQTTLTKLLPADGVYATKARLQIGDNHYCYNSVTNLGVRPTVDGLSHRLEVHLFDFPPTPNSLPPTLTEETINALTSGDIYDRHLTVEFIARLRGEQRFDGLDALVAQIQTDIAEAQKIFSGL